MTPKQTKTFMDGMEQLALEYRGERVSQAVASPDGAVQVSARATLVGFVYWYYDGKPMPRKRVQGLLEHPGIKEVL